MRRGDIYWVDLEPSRGSEANKRRPAVIVSRNDANTAVQETGRGTVTVVPLTTNVTFVAPFQVFIPVEESGLSRDSKAQAEQVRTVSVNRLGQYIGFLTFAVMLQIDDALRLHLDL